MRPFGNLTKFGFLVMEKLRLNRNPPRHLTIRELIAIDKWMKTNAGGIFACGDHGRIGSNLCGEIPRVRLMQKWNSRDPPVTPITPGNRFPRNTLLPGLDNFRTPDIDESLLVEDSDQSDDVPMRLFPIAFGQYHLTKPLQKKIRRLVDNSFPKPHPLLTCGGFRREEVIRVFPDHMHEGEVVRPEKVIGGRRSHLSPGLKETLYLSRENERIRVQSISDPKERKNLRKCLDILYGPNKDYLLKKLIDILADPYVKEIFSTVFDKLYYQRDKRKTQKVLGKLLCPENKENRKKVLNKFFGSDYVNWKNDLPNVVEFPNNIYWDIVAFGISFQEVDEVRESRAFPVLGAYDGHQIGNVKPLGRIVVDSSFHHWTDVNLTGNLLFNSEFPPPFIDDPRKTIWFLNQWRDPCF